MSDTEWNCYAIALDEGDEILIIGASPLEGEARQQLDEVLASPSGSLYPTARYRIECREEPVGTCDLCRQTRS